MNMERTATSPEALEKKSCNVLGFAIRQRRTELHMSPLQLALLLGVPDRIVSLLEEQGPTNLVFLLLPEIAHALDCTEEGLLRLCVKTDPFLMLRRKQWEKSLDGPYETIVSLSEALRLVLRLAKTPSTPANQALVSKYFVDIVQTVDSLSRLADLDLMQRRYGAGSVSSGTRNRQQKRSKEPTELGAYLEQKRISLGLTRKQMDIALGKTYPFIASVELGYSRKPKYPTLLRIAEVLGEPLDDIIRLSEYKTA